MLELRKTLDYGRSFQTIATRVYSFVLGGKFVLASIMTGSVCVCFLYLPLLPLDVLTFLVLLHVCMFSFTGSDFNVRFRHKAKYRSHINKRN